MTSLLDLGRSYPSDSASSDGAASAGGLINSRYPFADSHTRLASVSNWCLAFKISCRLGWFCLESMSNLAKSPPSISAYLPSSSGVIGSNGSDVNIIVDYPILMVIVNDPILIGSPGVAGARMVGHERANGKSLPHIACSSSGVAA